MADEKKRVIEYDMEVVSTPAGKLPTAKSMENLINGLNILNEDMNEHRKIINEALISQMGNFESELFNLKKMISEHLIKVEATRRFMDDLRDDLQTQTKQVLLQVKKLENRVQKFEQTIEKKIVSALENFIKSSRT